MTTVADGAARPHTRPGALPGVTLAIVILIWGIGPPISKLISAPPLVTVFVRFWISVPILVIAARATGGRVNRTTLRSTWLAGTLFAANLACVFFALQRVSIAVLSVVQALQPGIVLVMAAVFLGERITRWHVLWTLVGIFGTAVVVLGASKELRASVGGVALSVAAMVTFTAYFLIAKRVRSTTDLTALEWMAGSTLFSALAITPITLGTMRGDDFAKLGGWDWVWLLIVTLGVGVISHVMMSWVTRFVDASRSALYLLAFNVVAVAVAWPIHHEPLTPWQFVGGAVVLGAVAAVVSRPANPANPPSLIAESGPV